MLRRFALLTAALVLVLFSTACGAKDPVPPVENTPPAVEKPSVETPTTDPVTPEQEEEISPETATPVFDFAEVADVEFAFSSGAGAWRTMLYIHADGTFDGFYLDSDMGDLDEETYPNGTCYTNNFAGRFTQPEQVNDYTWRMQVAELTHAYPFGEELKDGFRYVYTEAYGISGAENVYLYLPSAPLADLPEAYRNWVGYYDLSGTIDTTLPFYGLYNEAQENGFAGYTMPTLAELAQREIEQAEFTAAELEAALENAMTQLDMNTISGELYRVWDTALNNIWQQLKRELNDEAMQQLTTEQLAWIDEKEATVAAAGAEYEGGSMQGMVMNLEAAELTRQRIYILAEHLK